jgi:hypothetical protein
MSYAPYRVRDNVLSVHGAELLIGPTCELEHMAAALNASPPESLGELQDAVRRLIMDTRNCSFATGPALKGAGIELEGFP